MLVQIDIESPHFGLPIQTVTVIVGQTARLTCFVQNLGDYEVAWMNKGTNAVLSIGKTIITKDPRISVQREQRSTWVLTIINVTIQDHGYYTCNINTLPPTSIQGFINVVEPPILEDGDEEVWVMEGMSAFLSCHARGIPLPSYKWIREDYNVIRINSTTTADHWLSKNLSLHQVNHLSAGGYICIVSNGFPPSVSKRVMVHVFYSPLIRGQGMEIKARLGHSVSLTCLYTAHPVPSVEWIRDNNFGRHILTKDDFTITPQDGYPPYTHNITLKIRKLRPSDFGRYTCIVRNSQGEATYSTLLKEDITMPLPVTSTEDPPISSLKKLSHLITNMTSQTSNIYHIYDDKTKNLTAPLIINMNSDVFRDRPSKAVPTSRGEKRLLITFLLIFNLLT